MKTLPTNLVHVLIGKSIIETLLVGTLAVFTFLNLFPPFFHGWSEVTETGISGWVVNNALPWERVEVQLFVDGEFLATSVASLSRPDVLAAGWSRDEWHGYTFPLVALKVGPHEARVYALHDSGAGRRKTLQMVGDPVAFSVNPGGRLSRPPAAK